MGSLLLLLAAVLSEGAAAIGRAVGLLFVVLIISAVIRDKPGRRK